MQLPPSRADHEGPVRRAFDGPAIAKVTEALDAVVGHNFTAFYEESDEAGIEASIENPGNGDAGFFAHFEPAIVGPGDPGFFAAALTQAGGEQAQVIHLRLQMFAVCREGGVARVEA